MGDFGAFEVAAASGAGSVGFFAVAALVAAFLAFFVLVWSAAFQASELVLAISGGVPGLLAVEALEYCHGRFDGELVVPNSDSVAQEVAERIFAVGCGCDESGGLVCLGHFPCCVEDVLFGKLPLG